MMRGRVPLTALFIALLLLVPLNITGETSSESEPVPYSTYTPHDPIVIAGNDDLADQASSEGWPGDGSESNPYVIQGYYINAEFNYESCIYINGTDDHVRITNCKLDNSSQEGYSTDNRKAGVLLDYAENVRIDNCSLTGNHLGIALFLSDSNFIVDNEINSGWAGIRLFFAGARFNVINDNVVNNSGRGIYLGSGIGSGIPGNTVVFNELKGNTLTGCMVAFMMWETNYNTISDSVIRYCGAAIDFTYTYGNTAKDNLIVGGYILLRSADFTTVKNNTFLSASFAALAIDWSNNNTIEYNNFINGEGPAIYIGDPLFGGQINNNNIYHNNFIDNNKGNRQVAFYGNGYLNDWDSDLPLGGNYWSDHTGPDADGDGFVDEPYDIDEGNINVTDEKDNFPHVVPNGWDLKSKTHTVLVEDVVTTWCHYCSEAMDKWRELIDDDRLDFEFVALIADATPDAEDRSYEDYSVNSFPTVEIDGGAEELSNEDMETYFNAILEASKREVTPLDLSINGENTGSGGIRVSAYVKNNDDEAYSGYLKVYIIEESSRYDLEDNSKAPKGLLAFAIDENISLEPGATYTTEVSWNGNIYNDLNGNNFGDIDHENIRLVGAVFDDMPHPKFRPGNGAYTTFWADNVVGSRLTKGMTGPVLNINTDEVFSTIQEAIDDMDTIAGHTIEVGPGTYTENLIISKPITLQGAGAENTIIDGSSGKVGTDVIHISTDDVVISGFTITGGSEVWGAGIEMDHVQNCEIFNNNISGNNNYGIRLHYSSDNDIHDNMVMKNENGGIYLWFSSDNTLTYNDAISNNGTGGIYLFKSHNNDITFNKVFFNQENGISLDGADGNTFWRNDIYKSRNGLWADFSDGNTISGNAFIDCQTQAYDNSPNNTWDDGYPQGGNYWSDWDNRPDEYSGSNQDQPGSDGIKDVNHYIVGGASPDQYPLVKPQGDSRYLLQGTNSLSPYHLTFSLEDTNVTEALVQFESGYTTVQTYDSSTGTWKHHNPDIAIGSYTIDEIDFYRGILVNLSKTAINYPIGPTPTDVDNDVSLYIGWNLVGFPSSTGEEQVSTALNGVSYFMIQSYDGNTGSWTIMSTTDYMVPGESYWIYSDANQLWDVP